MRPITPRNVYKPKSKELLEEAKTKLRFEQKGEDEIQKQISDSYYDYNGSFRLARPPPTASEQRSAARRAAMIVPLGEQDVGISRIEGFSLPEYLLSRDEEMARIKAKGPKKAPVKTVKQEARRFVHTPYPDSEKEQYKYLKFNNSFEAIYKKLQGILEDGGELYPAEAEMIERFVDKLDIQENNANLERARANRLLQLESIKTKRPGPLREIPPRLEEGGQDRIMTYLENLRATKDANRKEINASPRVLSMMRELANYNKEEDEGYNAAADSADAYSDLKGEGMPRPIVLRKRVFFQ